MQYVIFAIYILGALLELIDDRKEIARYKSVSFGVDMLFFTTITLIELAWPIFEAWNLVADIRNFVSQKFRRS